ncbi:MAG: hypothetical protein V8T51_01005 [Senegalimassilia faecalis]
MSLVGRLLSSFLFGQSLTVVCRRLIKLHLHGVQRSQHGLSLSLLRSGIGLGKGGLRIMRPHVKTAATAPPAMRLRNFISCCMQKPPLWIAAQTVLSLPSAQQETPHVHRTGTRSSNAFATENAAFVRLSGRSPAIFWPLIPFAAVNSFLRICMKNGRPPSGRRP